MKKYLVIIILFMLSIQTWGQKQIEISNDRADQFFLQEITKDISIFALDNLKQSKDLLSIRIWNRNSIIELRKNKICTVQLINFIKTEQPIIQKTKFDHQIAEQLLDTLISYHAITLPDNNFKGIDDQIVTVEVSTPDKYRLYSYKSPSCFKQINCIHVAKMNNACNKLLQQKQRFTELINQLKPGNYPIGNSFVYIDHFVADSIPKSDLYKKVCAKLKRKFKLNRKSNHDKFPHLLLDNKVIFLKDLNQYHLKNIAEIRSITKKHEEIFSYGSMADRGLILITSKKTQSTTND